MAAERLHAEVRGHGADLLLVHGWGMHGGVWEEVGTELARDYRVTAPDLPGHGHSGAAGASDLGQICERLLDSAPPKSVWIGWSLGGMACLQAAARAPERVRGLVLVASSACFVRTPDWPHALDAAVFDAFAADLERDPTATLQRFLALQAAAGHARRETLRRLRGLWRAAPEPALPALRAGLAILRHIDLRALLPQIQCPVLLLTGACDNLVPAAALPVMAAALRTVDTQLIAAAGHAPLVSDVAEFCARLRHFLQSLGAA